MSSKAAVLLFGTLLVVLFFFNDICAVECDLMWSTFVGGNWYDEGRGIALDSVGFIFVTGWTRSEDFPVTAGAYATSNAGIDDAFAFKLAPAGDSLIYATYIGGSGEDEAEGIAVDDSGNAFIVGSTYSSDFPVTPGAFDTSHAGSRDVFVTKLNAIGSLLEFSTFLGGESYDYGWDIEVDDSSNTYVIGHTYSADFCVTAGAIDTTLSGDYDAFFAKLNFSGSEVDYATFLGGSDIDRGYGLCVDDLGDVYLTGSTKSEDFPITPGAFDTTWDRYNDAFMTKLDLHNGQLLYSTYLGGEGGDYGQDLLVDDIGQIYLSGRTSSLDFPTTPGSYNETCNGGWDVFVAKFTATGDSLVYSTYVGGSILDDDKSIAVDDSGKVCVVGHTESADFPTTAGALDTTLDGDCDAFLFVLSPMGDAIEYATYLGGWHEDYCFDVALDNFGHAFLTGKSHSYDFPLTEGAFDTTYHAYGEVFVTKLNISLRPPEAIDDLTAHLDGGRNEKSFLGNIRLFWSEPYDETGVDHYVIYRSKDPASFSDALAIVSDTTYLDPDIAGDEYNQYFYMIQAVDGAGRKSPDSNTVGEFDNFLGFPY